MSKWVTILFIAVCVSLIAAAIFRILTPQNPPIPQTQLITENFNGSRSQFANITFSGSTPVVPNTFSVVTTESQSSPEVLKNTLISSFNLTPSANSPTIFNGPEYYLSVTNSSAWVLSRNATNPPPNIVDKESSLQVATQFVNQYLPNLSFLPQTDMISYYHGDEIHFDEDSADDANIIAIPFAQSIDFIPLYQVNKVKPQIVIWLTSDNQVFKAEFTPPYYNLGVTTATLNSIPVEKAVANINNNQASIIQSTQSEFGPVELSQIVSGDLKTVLVEYRLDPDLLIAYPFYRFSGTVKNTNGTQMEVQIITPAVATTTQ